MTLRWVWLTAFEHTRRGLRPWRTFGTNVCCFLPCQTFVPNVRHGVLARHDAYVLWVSPLDISEGLRPSVNMQWDLSEVLLAAFCCLRFVKMYRLILFDCMYSLLLFDCYVFLAIV